MITVAGVFRTREDAGRAARELHLNGIRSISLVAPANAEEATRVPTSAAEQPGMGQTLGGVLGGALGIAGGFELGTAAASLVLPGVGPVVATGILAATLLGAGGAIGGAAAGAALENKTTAGLPEDELYVYKDALRQGQCVVFVQSRDPDEASWVRGILDSNGADSVDAARDQWWIGLRDVKKEHYR
jgi:hypothetical protein